MPSNDLPSRCGYCGSTNGFEWSPHGRPFCVSCGAFPADWQEDGEPGGGRRA